MNREASEECVRRARSHMSAGRLEDALRFAKKAAGMKGGDVHQAETLIKIISEKMTTKSSTASGTRSTETSKTAASATSKETGTSPDGMRYRRTTFAAQETTRKRTTSPARTSARPHTPQQATLVRKVLQARNLYDRLGVDRNAEPAAIKRAFKKLALKLHPDKNPAPQADKAFQAANKAHEVLSDPQKRRHYDMTGQETPGRPTMRAEDVFANMGMHDNPFEFFFAGGAPGFRAYRYGPNFGGGGGGGGFRYRQRERRHREHEDAQAREAQRMNLLGWMGMIMIMFLIFGGSFSPDSNASNLYSLQRTKRFHIARHTHTNPPVPYFVDSDFEQRFLGDTREHRHRLRQLEQHVYRDYYRDVEMKCYQERELRSRRIREVRRRRLGKEDLDRAKAVPTPSCEILKQLLQTGGA